MSRYSEWKRFRCGMTGDGVPLGFGKGKDWGPFFWFAIMWGGLTDTGNAVFGHFLIPIIHWCKTFHLEDKEMWTLIVMVFLFYGFINFKKED